MSTGTKSPKYDFCSAHAPKPPSHAACSNAHGVWIQAPPLTTRLTLLLGHFLPRQRDLSLMSPLLPQGSASPCSLQSHPVAGKAVAQGSLREFLPRVSVFCVSFANTEAGLEWESYFGRPHINLSGALGRIWGIFLVQGRNLWNSWHWQRNIRLGWLLVLGAAVNASTATCWYG